MLIPLWDRKRLNDSFTNVYLIPSELHEKLSSWTEAVDIGRVYSYHFTCNYVLVTASTYRIELDETYVFETDVSKRVGMVEYTLTWIDAFGDTFPFIFGSTVRYLLDEPSTFVPTHGNRASDGYVCLCSLFTHWNGSHLVAHRIDDVLSRFNVSIPPREWNGIYGTFASDYWIMDEWTDDLRLRIANWSIEEELKRLHAIPFFSSLILQL